MTLSAPIKYLWASPATLVGLCGGAVALALGGNITIHTGVLEISLPAESRWAAWLAARLPFSAITFGHTVFAVSKPLQHFLRRHERVHVAQYELWGPLFLVAYPAESLLQFLRGRRAYFDNRFEVAARAGESQNRS